MALSGGRPAPTHVIAHLSDPHLLGSPEGRLAGRIDTAEQLRRALERVESCGEAIDALVISGDLADSGEPRPTSCCSSSSDRSSSASAVSSWSPAATTTSAGRSPRCSSGWRTTHPRTG